jgi:anion-transporting  ArsA/GET3 family ATPase
VNKQGIPTFSSVVAGARVIVCCGSGGVGKTTTAAAIGIAAAAAGRNVAVITIDPAKRLADALGIDELGNDPKEVAVAGTGSLHALMLDTKATFDAVVRRSASSPAQAEKILANSLYGNISSSLSGTQEYMAAEKVHELVNALTPTGAHRFDLVVIDTPPTRNAVDFLTAPRRLVRFLDNTVFRALMASGRGTMRIVGVAAQTVLRPLTKIVGAGIVDDAIEFFRAFDGMEAGFRDRATEVLELLSDVSSAWVVVTAARPEPVAEAEWFADTLTANGISVQALIVNRTQPDVPVPAALSATATGHLLAEMAELHRQEQLVIGPLRARLGAVPVVDLRNRAATVQSLEDLSDLAAELVGKLGLDPGTGRRPKRNSPPST